MTIPQYLIVTAGLAFLTSCSPRFLSSAVKPAEVQDLQKFETLSYISLIEKGNRGMVNDTISNTSKEVLHKVLASFNKIPVTGQIIVSDPSVNEKLQLAIANLCISADRQRAIVNLTLPRILDSLLEEKGKRFGLLTITTGFTRTKRNYGGQMAKGVAMGVLTLGMFYQTPVKANSTIYAMIVDAQENNVAFFRKSALQDKEPLNEAVLKRQLQTLFENYFWAKE
jgi:hypothetical protein